MTPNIRLLFVVTPLSLDSAYHPLLSMSSGGGNRKNFFFFFFEILLLFVVVAFAVNLEKFKTVLSQHCENVKK